MLWVDECNSIVRTNICFISLINQQNLVTQTSQNYAIHTDFDHQDRFWQVLFKFWSMPYPCVCLHSWQSNQHFPELWYNIPFWSSLFEKGIPKMSRFLGEGEKFFGFRVIKSCFKKTMFCYHVKGCGQQGNLNWYGSLDLVGSVIILNIAHLTFSWGEIALNSLILLLQKWLQ